MRKYSALLLSISLFGFSTTLFAQTDNLPGDITIPGYNKTELQLKATNNMLAQAD